MSVYVIPNLPFPWNIPVSCTISCQLLLHSFLLTPSSPPSQSNTSTHFSFDQSVLAHYLLRFLKRLQRLSHLTFLADHHSHQILNSADNLPTITFFLFVLCFSNNISATLGQHTLSTGKYHSTLENQQRFTLDFIFCDCISPFSHRRSYTNTISQPALAPGHRIKLELVPLWPKHSIFPISQPVKSYDVLSRWPPRRWQRRRRPWWIQSPRWRG